MRVALCLVAMAAVGWCADFRGGRLRRQGRWQNGRHGGHPEDHRRRGEAGGTIVLKPGVYLSGSLFLKSGTHLRLDEGVVIRGVQSLAGYPMMQTRVAGIEMKWPAALINVYEQSGVKISGQGTIDGDGKIWWDRTGSCGARITSPRASAGPPTTIASGRG
jgi:hypothetical protein